eukprot:148437-Pyramimonas_sp.AAC.1
MPVPPVSSGKICRALGGYSTCPAATSQARPKRDKRTSAAEGRQEAPEPSPRKGGCPVADCLSPSEGEVTLRGGMSSIRWCTEMPQTEA